MPTDSSHTIAELSALTDIPVRTIRYYVAQGILPAPGREGPSTRYDDAFLARLRLVRQLRASHLPLAEIRARLAELTDDEAIELVGGPAPEPPDSALEYVRALLEGPTGPSAGPGYRPLPQATRLAEEPPPSEVRVALEMEAPKTDLLRRVDAARAPMLRRAAPPAPSGPPPLPTQPRTSTPERSQWERIVLEQDVELHVRRPLTRHQNKRVERLVAFARELQEGDKP